MGYDIFFSYSRRNTKIQRQVVKALLAQEFTVWTDENLNPGTAEWQAAIEEAIKQSRCVVVLLSPASKLSKWVNLELSVAEINGKKIFPILIKGNEKNAVPMILVNTQYVDFQTNANIGFYKLVQSIKQYFRSTKQIIEANPPQPSTTALNNSSYPNYPTAQKTEPNNSYRNRSTKSNSIQSFIEDTSSCLFWVYKIIIIFIWGGLIGIGIFWCALSFMSNQVHATQTETARLTQIEESTATANVARILDAPPPNRSTPSPTSHVPIPNLRTNTPPEFALPVQTVTPSPTPH